DDVNECDVRYYVSDPPVGQPVLSLEKRHYTIGDTLKGNCTSPPSSPPSNVTWYLNDKWVLKDSYDVK
ncbi:Ig-like domain-containing protein, partial [Aphis craccivora]